MSGDSTQTRARIKTVVEPVGVGAVEGKEGRDELCLCCSNCFVVENREQEDKKERGELGVREGL